MFELKPLSRKSIPAALEKAERYRLLNEAREAESICLDILEVEPDNHRALITLTLALTDQFGRELGVSVNEVRRLLPRLPDEYERAYYGGIICERWAKAQLAHGQGAESIAHDWFREAMALYEKAGEIRPPGNDDATLRWNTCARTIMRHEAVRPGEKDHLQEFLE